MSGLKDYIYSQDLSVDELEDIEDSLRETIARIKTQIDEAEDKSEIDREWLHRARHSLRTKSVELQIVSRERGKLRKQEAADAHLRAVEIAKEKAKLRAEGNKSDERLFIEVARRRLLPSLYQDIWDEADELREEIEHD